MPRICTDIGSKAWVDQVFSSPPARKVKGRTRWTHRHLAWVQALGRLAYVESRNELIGLLALEYMARQGIITRFKEQPVKFGNDFLPGEYTPDFGAQDTSNQVYVIEVKTKRYISREMEKQFEEVKAKLAEVGMKYLVWTDQDPLVHPLRHNLLQLRRASTEDVRAEEIARLVDFLKEKGPMPLWALYERELDATLINHAAWHGRVFVPLLKQLDTTAKVSLEPCEDLAAALLGAEPDLHRWWNSLEVTA